jgi:haloalkane dehalogenase
VKDTFKGYDFHLSRHPWRGMELSYVDTLGSQGQAKPAIVLLHGNPTWSYLYRKMIAPLADRFRVIAPDLLGFGLSTKPRDPANLSFESHVASILDLLAALEIQDSTLVGQDWGGPILSAAAASGELAPAGLVLMNTYLPGQPLSFGAYSLAFHRRWSPILVQNFDFLRRVAFRFGFRHRPEPAVLAAYRHPHNVPATRNAILSLLQSVPTRADSPGREFLKRVDTYLRTTRVPKLLIFSGRDPIFSSRRARHLAQDLPAAQFEMLPGAGHFLQEDAGPEVAALILRWADELEPWEPALDH